MADIETAAWSETAASNIQPSPDGWPPNSSPNIVYTTDRETMGAIKRDWNRRNAVVTSGGSANAQTLAYIVNPTALVRGQRYAFIAGFTNTGPMTLTVGGLAATAVQVNGAALVGGELTAGLITDVIYTGSVFQIVGGSGAGWGDFLPLAGTTTNNNAAAGNVGEYISSVVASPGITLTNNIPANVTSISLTAGDWDVSGEAWINVGAGGATQITAAITSTSATIPAGPAVGISRAQMMVAIPVSTNQMMPLSGTRVSIAATTTFYLVAFAAFPSGTTTAYGKMEARRRR